MDQLAPMAALAPLLIVDDEPGICRLIAGAARDLGLPARAVHDGEAFKQAYTDVVPQIVVLDLNIPGCDGIELLRFLADQRSPARILMISGFGDRILQSAQRLAQLRGLQVAGIVSKPIRLAELKAALDQARSPA